MVSLFSYLRLAHPCLLDSRCKPSHHRSSFDGHFRRQGTFRGPETPGQDDDGNFMYAHRARSVTLGRRSIGDSMSKMLT